MTCPNYLRKAYRKAVNYTCQNCRNKIVGELPAFIEHKGVCQFCFGQIKNKGYYRSRGWVE